MSPWRTAVVVLVALVLQVCLFAQFSYEGARPDVMVLVAVLAGYVAGADRGASIAFACGLAFDMVLTTPLGLNALVYTVVAYVVGSFTEGLVRSSRWVPILLALAGSAAAMVAYALIGAVFGEPTLDGPALPTIVVTVSLVNAVFAPVAAWALRWARTEDRDRRSHVFAR